MKSSIVPEIVEILTEDNFFVELSEIFVPDLSPYTFLYNETNMKGIVIREYSLNEEEVIKEINHDVSQIRNKLNHLDYNVWNIYYFIVNTSEIVSKNIYAIERDYRSLRKYVISSLNDLNRIPFISCSSKENTPLNISRSLFDELVESSDKEIKNLVEYILSNKGEYIEFKKGKIKEILNENLSQGEFK